MTDNIEIYDKLAEEIHHGLNLRIMMVDNPLFAQQLEHFLDNCKTRRLVNSESTKKRQKLSKYLTF